MKSLALAIFTACLTAGFAAAQETPRVTFDFGAGFTTPVNNTSNYLNTGWNVQGGIGANLNPYFGAKLQLDYNSLGVNGATLDNLGYTGGGIHIFSATVDPIIHLNPHGHIGIYLIGGGGVYHHADDFSGVGTFTGPFSGNQYYYPFASSYTVTKPGINGGVGVEVGTRHRGKIFAEARFNRIFLTSSTHEDYLPVSFGFRW